MDEIFGDLNFVGEVIIQTATDNNPRLISIEHEYILCYCNNKSKYSAWDQISFSAGLIMEEYKKLKQQNEEVVFIQKQLRGWLKLNKKRLKRVSHYKYVDGQGVYYEGDISNTQPGGYDYNVFHPITNKICKLPPNGYRFPKDTINEMIAKDDIIFGKDETTIIKPKRRLDRVSEKFRSIYYEDGRDSTNELASLFNGKKLFDNPKSKHLLKYIMGFIPKNKDMLVLDSFIGSGSTMDAVMEMNFEDGGNRKVIGIQLKEEVPKTNKNNKPNPAYEFGFRYIHEITKARIEKVAGGYINSKGESVEGLGGGFQYYRVDAPLFTKEKNNIVSSITWEQLAPYLYHSEFRTAFEGCDIKNKPLVGEYQGTGLYLLYKAPNMNVLNYEMATLISKNKNDRKVVYADSVDGLDYEELEQMGIEFKQIPYDIFGCNN
jgi:adenine-specific DNA-methyltransferase